MIYFTIFYAIFHSLQCENINNLIPEIKIVWHYSSY